VVEWKRNLAFLWIAQFFSLVGFGFALPFVPFYFQELGITGRGALRIWTGLFAAGSGIPLAIAAPIWGSLADQYGRKPMSLRASLGGAVVLAGMGLARSPGMLLVFRVLQGVFTGTITANLTLVVSNTPEKRMGFAIGIMNSAVFAGDTLGPLVGGFCADLFGYRVSFLVSAISLVISFLITLVFVREDFQRPQGPAVSAPLRLSAVRTAVVPFLPVIGMIALAGFARYLAVPLYPLLVQEIALPSLGLATQTGMVNAAAGVAVVLAGIVFGRLADRGAFTRVGAACALAAGVFTAGLAAVRSIALLVPLRMAADFSYGGLDPLLSMLLARRVDAGRRGLAFGLAGSVRSAAWACGAMAGGLLSAAAGFWAVFLLGGVLFLTGAWLLARRP
jgi:DHA1 family multidrug resistance protein-like MFS transporter